MLPDIAQALALELVQAEDAELCASCQQRPKAKGRIMCHECREVCGLYEQLTIGEEDE